jgi:hypothetical protein
MSINVVLSTESNVSSLSGSVYRIAWMTIALTDGVWSRR